MLPIHWLQLALFFAALLITVKPLGGYIARVYAGERTFLSSVCAPLERAIYRLAGVKPDEEMDWKRYALAALAFNLIGLLVVYALQRLQATRLLNPQQLGAVAPDLAFNTAVSFTSNTNWQSYAGERTLSYLTQMVGLTVQNFVSAATGMAVLIALIRGLARHSAKTIGSFWTDLVRGTVHILLPLSLVVALLLVSQGVVQTLAPSRLVSLVQPITSVGGQTVGTQTLALGPVASQVAIKQLGTNGGGFFNVNSAHPFENATPFSNFIETLAILIIPAALCYTFGKMVRDTRQGWAVLAAMLILFTAMLIVPIWAETQANPRLTALGTTGATTPSEPGGNMEGKEVRFGPVNSALWSVATTAASNGSVNAMHDSLMPLGGLAPLWLIQLGEVVFGGVGSGLYGMLAFVIVGVFIAGLMVGRTPEYLGKKIGAAQVKMATLVILIPPLTVLFGSALAVLVPAGVAAVANPGPHGFTEILYAFSSAANNNGSAFAGLAANTPFYNTALGLAMLIGRYWVMVPTLALAGSLAGLRHVPAGSGTLPTSSPLFVGWLVVVVVVVGALSFLPALALGPVVEQLMLFR
jgi:K+-transporting ATPase ATPase A chain